MVNYKIQMFHVGDIIPQKKKVFFSHFIFCLKFNKPGMLPYISFSDRGRRLNVAVVLLQPCLLNRSSEALCLH